MATGFTKNFVVKNGITTGNITLDAGTGNITGTNLSVTGVSDLGNVGNVHITGGTSGYVLSTDGSGNLSFIDPSASAQSPAPMPVVIDAGNTLTIAANYQGMFGYPLTVNGTLDVEGILIDVNDAGGGTATSVNASVSNVIITGGTSGYYLQTDGAGNLSWAAGGGGGSGSPGGVNTQVQFNDAGNFGGNANLTFNKTTGTLSASVFSGAGNALSNIQGANVSGQVGNSLVAGTVYTAAQPNITSTGTLTDLSVSGNANVGNLNASGTLSVTGVSTLGAVGNVKITGGTSGYYLQTDGTGNLSWAAGGGGGGGQPVSDVFYENSLIVSANYTITSGKSAMSTGPITISSGVVVTVPSGSKWVVL